MIIHLGVDWSKTDSKCAFSFNGSKPKSIRSCRPTLSDVEDLLSRLQKQDVKVSELDLEKLAAASVEAKAVLDFSRPRSAFTFLGQDRPGLF